VKPLAPTPVPPPARAGNETAPPAQKPVHPTIDLIVEKAAEAALKADQDRKHAEEVAAELKAKVAELTKKLQAVEKVEKSNEHMLRKVPETETERQKSWFKRVANLHETADANSRKWAAIREEERLAREAQIKASEDRPRRIPIGANEPEPKEAYAVAVPAGQEAYSERHSHVKAVGIKFPVLSVSKDGTQIRIAAPNDGSFPVGPARMEADILKSTPYDDLIVNVRLNSKCTSAPYVGPNSKCTCAHGGRHSQKYSI
jgi:hypothetical protein